MKRKIIFIEFQAQYTSYSLYILVEITIFDWSFDNKVKYIMREPITPEEKLPVNRRYLAAGEIFESLMYQFRVHQTRRTKFIHDVRSQYALI